MSKPALILANKRIGIEEKSGYVNITDMAKMKSEANSSDLLRNWMRASSSVSFFLEWELLQDPDFNTVDFDGFKNQAGSNTFFISTKDLVAAGATGIFAKAGRYGGTYAHIDWAIHFANWMDPRFYVLTIKAFRQMSDYFVGRSTLHHRFTRELAAKNYNLIGKENRKRKLAQAPYPMTSQTKTGNKKSSIQRYLTQVDADIINLAAFGMTALDWRSRFPQKNANLNMRDFATTEELHVVNALQHELTVLQQDLYTPEEKLDRLRNRAQELLIFYCDTDEKVATLEKQRKERGW